MLALKNVVKLTPQVRQMSAIATKPLNRVSFAEKVVHGVVMTVAYCTIPAWVLVHIRNYRGLE